MKVDILLMEARGGGLQVQLPGFGLAGGRCGGYPQHKCGDGERGYSERGAGRRFVQHSDHDYLMLYYFVG
jgi:hypothetical protein